MNFRKAADMDDTVGRLIVWYASILPPFPQDIPPNITFDSILVMKFFGSGTILQAIPFICALKRSYPHASIDLLTFAENRQIVESLNLFRTVHVIEWRGGLLRLFGQTVGFVARNWRKYSLTIDLEFFANYSAIVTKMLGSRYSLGFGGHSEGRRRCYSRTVIFDHSNHVRHIFLKFLDALGLSRPAAVSLMPPRVPETAKSKVDRKFPELHENLLRLAVNINAGEMCANRRWPEEHFHRLIDIIQSKHPGVFIYLTGGREDAMTVRCFYDALSNTKNVHILAGELDILEFTCVLSRMHVFITNDSGPMHIAEAVGVPIVCFFGPETPNLYGPLSSNSLAFYANRFCSPCLNTYNHKRVTCMDNQCLKVISPETVYEKMAAMYWSTGRLACSGAPEIFPDFPVVDSSGGLA